MGFHISEDGILHSHGRENLKSHTVLLKKLHKNALENASTFQRNPTKRGT
jgi:hypothetical protein